MGQRRRMEAAAGSKLATSLPTAVGGFSFIQR